MAPSLDTGELAAERAQLRARARALGGALAETARGATTLGRERAILRLIGVGGIDREGRPLAAEVVDRYVSGRQDRLATGVGLAFAVALLEYDSTPQSLALDVAAGAVDLALEAELLDSAPRRSAAAEHLGRLIAGAVARIDANRVARRELMEVLGDRQPPWIGTTLHEPASDAAEGEIAALVHAGLDLLRVEVPAGRELAIRLGELGHEVGWRPRTDDVDEEPAPAGSQRGLARLRTALDRAAAERGAYVRLAIAPTALAAPEGAIVAAFERADLLDLDPMAEIVVTGVDPERALADYGFAVRVVRRAGAVIHLGAGPLVVAPDLDAGINADPATRSGRALGLQLVAAEMAVASGLSAERIVVGALPSWLTGEPEAAARAAAEVALRRALLPEHPLAFVEPAGAEPPNRWAAIVAAVMPGSGVAVSIRRAQPGSGDASGMFSAARAVADVARELEAAVAPQLLTGIGREHAERAIAAAAATLATIERDGWPALTGATAARGGWGRLGGDAVTATGDATDPVERALA
ncbi:MAG: hypothetical protein HY264_02075, partial [Chloroflexi bacterium]|nr:hypothetical protein [Chloroflexota bacterium]